MPRHGLADRGAVVVTGTSTGIGAATAAHLADNGFRVLAGVRRQGDADALAGGSTGEVTPLLIDIADGESISAAARTVADAVGAHGLAGLVNNAGIVVPGPIEHQPIDDFRMQLEVNLVGHVAAIQAFLPLIRRGGGRIVNIGSIGGRMALSLHGAYSASKFGMEAVTDALRLELRQWRIPVSLVDPGATDTAIFGKTLAELDRVAEMLDAKGERGYDQQIAAVRAFVEKTAADAAPAAVVAKAVGSALTSDTPKPRYLAGKGARATAAFARALPDHVKDLAVAHELRLPGPE